LPPPPEAAPEPAPAPVTETSPPANAYQESKEEVVKVTIDRRPKTIQELSGSAQSFSQADLERKGVTSMRELTAATPYVEVGGEEGNIEIYIRGVGNSNDTEIGDPAAAVHIDGIYIPRPRGLGTMFYDLDRVEISRGPQGTLRGRNATAGTLNMISAQPKLGEWAAMGSFQFGNFMQRLSKSMVNIPLGDRVALRFATFTENRDPFYKNVGGNSNIRAAEDANTFSYRMSLKWQPTDHITVLLRHDNTFERGTGWVGSNYTQALQAGILPEEIRDPRSVSFVGVQPSQSLDHLGVSAELLFDLGPVNIELINSYRNLVYRQTTGTTGGVTYNG
jgi:iron complex outermembrane receptor protein